MAHEGVVADLARLVALYDRHDVRGGDPRPPTDADLAALDEVIGATNELLEQVRTLSAYLYTFISTDATDDDAAGMRSRLQTELADLTKLTKRFDAWVGRFGADGLVAGSTAAAEHAHPLRRAEAAAAHQMGEAEESLAAELRLSGSVAWQQLHGEVTSRLTADVDDGHGGLETAADHRRAGPGPRPRSRPAAAPPTTPSWWRGSRCRSRWRPRSTAPRASPTS